MTLRKFTTNKVQRGVICPEEHKNGFKKEKNDSPYTPPPLSSKYKYIPSFRAWNREAHLIAARRLSRHLFLGPGVSQGFESVLEVSTHNVKVLFRAVRTGKPYETAGVEPRSSTAVKVFSTVSYLLYFPYSIPPLLTLCLVARPHAPCR